MFARRFLRRLTASVILSILFIAYCQQIVLDVIKASANHFKQPGVPVEQNQPRTKLQMLPKSAIITQAPAVQPPRDLQVPAQPIEKADSNDGWEVVGKEKNLRLQMIQDHSPKHQGRTRLIVSLSGEFTNAHLGGCPDYNCRISNNRQEVEKADAVIMKMGASGSANKKRNPNQYFVYFTQESPMHSGASEPFAGFYNLTMGYRRDSDLPCPYGYTIKTKEPKKVDPISPELLKQKTKPVAWFVSNCHTPSKRKMYADALAKHVPIDIYGACGSLKCPKPAQRCNDVLRKSYRFYLAFENSICTDYITEKLWNQGYQADVVPIVLKRSLVEAYLPPDSFLAADDFESPAKLAEHIDRLMGDDEAYVKLLTSWKQNNEVVFLDGLKHDWRERPWGFCRLCDMLWDEPRPLHIKKDFSNWWKNASTCDHELVPRLVNGAAPPRRRR